MISEKDIGRLTGADVYTADGGKIGSVGQVYLDDETGRPEWIAVRTGLFGKKESFVPLAEATVTGDRVEVPYDKGKVTDAPRIEPDGSLSVAEEDQLYTYYDMRNAGPRVDADDYDAPELPGEVEDYVGRRRDVARDYPSEPGRTRLRRYLVSE